MKLSADSRWIRYAYFRELAPEQTNLCRLFWQVVGKTVFWAYLFIGLPFLYVFLWIRFPAIAAGVHAGVGFVALVFFSAERVARWRTRRWRVRVGVDTLPPKPPSVVKEAWWAVKNRVCPLIEIERE